jgi:Type II secretion system (T2SS), protein E, N-terminal domain
VSSSDRAHIPRTSDGGAIPAADTDPVGPVTPELALVDPGLVRGHTENEVTMSSMQFGDPQVSVEAPATVPLQPLEPLEPLQPLPPLQTAPAPEAPAAAAAPEEPAPAVPVSDMRDVPLGTLVFRAGLLPEEQLEEALQEGMKTGRRLGEILLERGWVSETDLGRLLAAQKGLPFVSLDTSAIDPTAPPLLPAEKARLHGALPVGFEDGVPVVAVADPSNDLVVENVRRALACEPMLVVAGRDALHRAINEVYGHEAAPDEAPAEHVAAPPVPAAPEPAQPVQPAPNGDGVWLAQQATVTAPQPAVPQAEPVVPAAPAVPAPVTAPEAQTAPAPEPPPAAQVELTHAVVLRLADDERLELGSFAGHAEAVEAARDAVEQITTEDAWPFFANRFIRPGGIVSVDVVELEVSRWLGSSARAAAWTPQ